MEEKIIIGTDLDTCCRQMLCRREESRQTKSSPKFFYMQPALANHAAIRR